MSLLEVLCHTAERQADDACAQQDTKPPPLPCDSFVARSAMQKAIRRGQADIALRAAASLTQTNSAVVWRRLLVTALEDLGIHELNTLVEIAAAIERRRFGLHTSPDWPLIQHLIRACCAGTRCQAANDLHNLALHSSRHEPFRLLTADLPVRDLLAIVGDSGRDLIERNIAVLTCLGVDYAPWTLQRPAVEPEAIISAVAGAAHPVARELYLWAFKKTGLPLATASMLLLSANGGLGPTLGFEDDLLPDCSWVAGVPTYALDQYTRIGRAVIQRYIGESDAWRGFANGLRIPRAVQRSAAGELLFRVEGAVVTRRASWDVARVLRDKSHHVGCFLPNEWVSRGMNVILADMPLLASIRAELTAAKK